VHSPIAVFAHRRPEHLAKTLDALVQNWGADEAEVTVYCDGPRSASEEADVERVRRVARQPRGFGALNVVERVGNLGLAKSVITGVSESLKQSDSIIVVEDDLVTSPAFLEYMNDGLRRFEADERVISIHGYCYPTPLQDPFFLRGADCWGWATWRRGWALFEPDGERLLQRLKAAGLRDLFDFHGAYPYTEMLEGQIAGRNDSWAIRWYASALLADRLTLYPGRTLVQNIGNDASGTHSGRTDEFDAHLSSVAPDLSQLEIAESQEARTAFEAFFRRLRSIEPPPRIWTRRLSELVRWLRSRVRQRSTHA
jgi:hypothetical protein